MQIKIDGFDEFKRNLKKLDADLPKVLKEALNEASEDVVTGTKRSMPKRSGRAAGTVKASATAKGARVREGGARAKYVPWLDFGGFVGKRNSVGRRTLPDGRYLYPAFYKVRDSGELTEAVSKALIKAANAAGVGMT